MHDFPRFEELDRDGAIEEAAAKAGVTRSQLLRRTAFAGGGLLIGGLPAAFTLAQGTSKRRRRHSQLRADARIPRGRVLQGGH